MVLRLTVKLLNLVLCSLLAFQQFNCQNPLRNKMDTQQISDQKMEKTVGVDHKHNVVKVIDAHLHIWASPEQVTLTCCNYKLY